MNSKILIVIPVYNEELIIEDSILKLNDFLTKQFIGKDYKVVLSDNNSTDLTKNKIINTIKGLQGFEYFFSEQQGKGNAIKLTWEKNINDYDLFVFLDADLATELSILNKVISVFEDYDLMLGDRYHLESKVKRTKKRTMISMLYRFMIRNILKSKISDFPCGFKVVKKNIVQNIIPLVQNNTWFFDSEMVYLSEKSGYKIIQLPINWKDTRSKGNKSKVNIFKVSKEYLKEIIRLKKLQ